MCSSIKSLIAARVNSRLLYCLTLTYMVLNVTRCKCDYTPPHEHDRDPVRAVECRGSVEIVPPITLWAMHGKRDLSARSAPFAAALQVRWGRPLQEQPENSPH